MVVCKWCGGTGFSPTFPGKPCPVCHGDTVVHEDDLTVAERTGDGRLEAVCYEAFWRDQPAGG